MSKIFEHCLLSQLNDYLETSELQCKFKPNVGFDKALAMFINTAQYFTSNGSTGLVAALDMSKAFVKVNHYALFLTLMSRGVSPCFMNLTYYLIGMVKYILVLNGTIVNRSSYNLLQELDKEVFPLLYFLLPPPRR